MKATLGMMLTLLLITTLTTASYIVHVAADPEDTTLFAPIIEDGTLTPGETFYVNITVAGLTYEMGKGLWYYDFILSYDTSVLTATAFSSYDPFERQWRGSINDEVGYVSMAFLEGGGPPSPEGPIGDFTISRIDFIVDSVGTSILDVHDTVLLSDRVWIPPGGKQTTVIPHVVVDGYFSNVVPLTSTVDIDPNTLNLMSEGDWITAYIELPEGYNVSDIDVTSLLLNGTIPVDVEAPITTGDYDSDTNPDLMVKFSRAAVISFIRSVIETPTRFSIVTLSITGELNDETSFQGNTTIRIIYIDIERLTAKMQRLESYLQEL